MTNKNFETTATKRVRTESGARVLMHVDHEWHRIEFEEASTKPINAGELVELLLGDSDSREELKWALENIHEYGMFFWKQRNGQSGCVDLTLYESRATHGWAATNLSLSHPVLRFHISMAGKLNDGIPDMTSIEAMLLVAEMMEMEKGLFGSEFQAAFKELDENGPSFTYEEDMRRVGDEVKVLSFDRPIRLPRDRRRRRPEPLGEPCL